MQKLSFLILLLSVSISFAQSPHGKNFNIDCEECHATDKWDIDYKKLKFNHAVTGFELVGQHKTLDCRNCHATIEFSNTDNQCSSCHTDMHQNSVGTNCENCHTSNSWLVQNINELHMMSRFPLEGAHKNANCIECHTTSNNLVFEPIGIECIDCHRPDYQSTKFPDHVAAGFSTDCQECHQITDVEWNKAKVTHDFFPLVGGHNIGNCFDCHNQNTFEGLTQDCYTCHQNDYSATIEPNHVANNFPTDCVQCHTTNPNWRPASFADHDNFFQLVGAHKIIENECNKCHVTGYSNTPDQCYECHKNNYDNTSNPSHKSTGFGTDCESCHNSNAWQPANFDHDNQFFPIYSGKHNNEWNNCSDCHTNLSDYQVFSCVTCHEHNQTEMNKEHNGINGYTYESTACLACHPTGNGEGGFNHSTTNFPLTGAHIQNECNDCHSSGYQGTSTLCSDCHTSDFQASTNPNHQQLGFDNNCAQCHTTNPDWQPATFASHNDFYLIQGAHSAIANDCSTCHNGNYVNTGNLCIDCHSNNYNNTNNPNHQATGFGTDCETCHTQNAWEPAEFDHDNQFFPIYSGKHNNEWNDCADCHTTASNFQIFECINCHEHNKSDTDREHNGVQGYQYISVECLACHPTGSEEGAFNHSISAFPLVGQHSVQECAECHVAGYANTPNECSECHQSDYNSSVDPNHNTAGISITCGECHSSFSWKPSTFNHSTTGFELAGSHNLTQCSDCHSGSTSNTSPVCYECHQSNYESAAEHVSRSYPTTCEDCHSPTSWDETTFDHNSTNFALTGAHSSEPCSSCHSSGYAGTSSDCYSCHKNNFNNAINPKHDEAGIAHECEDCHSTSAWKPSNFNHSTTGFKLVGGHNLTECSDCHSGSTSNASPVCYECHQSNYDSAPEHKTQNYPKTCEDCHSPTSWDETTFDHNSTNFALTGAHSSEPCSSCHSSGYAGTSSDCYSCHKNNFNNAINPKHDEAGIAHECEDCHSTSAWKPSNFNHSTTGFKLVGGHNLTECSDCHSGSTSNASPVCYECHQSNYDSAPEHKTQNYPKTCENCHSPTSWDETTFDHNSTNFALTGAHSSEPCSSCHSGGYAGTSSDCYSCHKNNFNNAINPKHDEAGIAHECEDCHSTSAWKPSNFNHSTTGFKLVGGHNLTECSDCHSGSTTNASPVCYECHQSNYDSAPEHKTQNYPKTCENCHNTTDWNDANFDHNSTNFALTGSHTTVSCGDCHTSGYSGTSTVCSDCHISDYNGSTNPNHSSLGLSTSCNNCHTTNPNWQPASFSVHNNYYVLQGAHSSIANDCSTCHSGNYNSTPNTCYGCHTSDYNSTTNPAHQTSGFGTGCEDCHSQNAWKPATFDHDGQYFPIYSGKHNGEWNTCSDCHTNSSNFSQFSCLECHEHSQTRMDDKHSGRSGYSYNSAACLDCHPDGKEEAFLQRIQGIQR